MLCSPFFVKFNTKCFKTKGSINIQPFTITHMNTLKYYNDSLLLLMLSRGYSTSWRLKRQMRWNLAKLYWLIFVFSSNMKLIGLVHPLFFMDSNISFNHSLCQTKIVIHNLILFVGVYNCINCYLLILCTYFWTQRIQKVLLNNVLQISKVSLKVSIVGGIMYMWLECISRKFNESRNILYKKCTNNL